MHMKVAFVDSYMNHLPPAFVSKPTFCPKLPHNYVMRNEIIIGGCLIVEALSQIKDHNGLSCLKNHVECELLP